MEILFRFFGLVALINERTSRFRINLIPMNWLILFGLGVGLVFSGQALFEGIVNGRKPQEVTLTDIAARADMQHNYVMVTGDLQIDETIVFTRNNEEEQAMYAPLTSSARQQALLVRINKNIDGVERLDGSMRVRVIGLLRRISEEHAEPLRDRGYKLGTFRVDPQYELLAGTQPASPLLMSIPTGLLIFAMLAMIITLFMRYVVFRPTAETVTELHERFADVPRVTGEFYLPQQNAVRRFLNVPALPLVAEDDSLLFVSNIDASSRFFGVKTKNLEGYWVLAVRPTDIRFTPGRLYIGIHGLPALRLHYTNGEGRPATALLSFSSADDRARMTGWLTMTPEQRDALIPAEEPPATPAESAACSQTD